MNRKNGPLSLLVISYFAFVVIGMPGGVLNIAWKYMEPTFHVELDSLGILLGVGTVGYLIMSFINGRVIGRLGISRALLSGGLLSALGMLTYVLVPTWETLVAFSIIASMGSGIIDAGLNTFVSAHYSAGRLNWLHAAFGVGATLGPLVATFTITRLDQSWRLSYGIAMILFMILSLCFFLTRQRWTLSLDETPDTRAPNISFRETLRAPLVIPLIGLFFLYAGLEVSAAQLANTLFIDGRGISQETAGTWISFYWFSFTAGRVIMGFFADRLTAQLIVRSGAIGAILGGLLLALNITPGFSFLGLALIGFALAPIFATLVAETPKRVGMRHAANAIGFEVGMAGVGIAMLPGLGGFLAQRVDLEIIGPFLVGVAVVMYALHEYVIYRETRIAAPEPAPVGQD
jgi:fucose permease